MFKLMSPAFQAAARIPSRFTGMGANVSPPLKWIGVPEMALELALICDDPDAPSSEPWVHWVIYGISPAATNGLPEHLPKEEVLFHPIKAIQGLNSFGNFGYSGPMPPVGHGVHRYFFKLLALDLETNYEPGLTKSDFLTRVRGHIIKEAQLIGTYLRTEETIKAAS